MSTDQVFFRRHSKSGEDVDDKFDVDVSKNAKIIQFVIVGVLAVVSLLYPMIDGEEGLILEWWVPPVFLLLCIPVILLWGKLGPSLAQSLTLKWLEKVSGKKPPTPGDVVLGFPFATKDPYFVEGNPVDFDITKPRVFFNRVKEAIFLVVGISMVISQTFLTFFEDVAIAQMDKWEYVNVYEMQIYSAIFVTPVALLILFFVLPIMWISEDMQIYRIDDLQDPHRVGMYVRTGPLSKILGFFGVVYAYNTAFTYASDYYTGESATVVYTWTFIYLGFIFLSCAVYPYFVSLVYLLYFHKEWVNTIRIKASDFLPVGTVQVNKVPPEETEYLTHQDKLSEFDKPDFSDKPSGKAIIAVLGIVVIAISIYLAFIW